MTEQARTPPLRRRYGTGTGEAMRTLWKQGGIGRFYQGLPYALMQARFFLCAPG